MKFADYSKWLIETHGQHALNQKLNAVRFTPEWVVMLGDAGLKNRMEAYFWCVDNCEGRYAIDSGVAFFTNEYDAIHFKLKWC